MNKQNFQQQTRGTFHNNTKNQNKNRKKNNANDENKFNGGGKNFNNANNSNNNTNNANNINKGGIQKPKMLPDDFVSSYISNVVSPPSPSKSFGSGHELNDQSNHFYNNRSPNKFHNNRNQYNKRNKKFGRSTSNNNIQSNNHQACKITTSPSDPAISTYTSNAPESPLRFNSILNELKSSPTKLTAMSEESKVLCEVDEIAQQTITESQAKPEVEILTPVSESSLLASVSESETMNSTIVNNNKTAANTSGESHSDKFNSNNISIAASEISENMYYSADETNQAQTSLSDFESFKIQSSSSSTSPTSSSNDETKEKSDESNEEASFSENAENKTLHDDPVDTQPALMNVDEDFVFVEPTRVVETTVETVVEQQQALMKCDSTLFFKDGQPNVEAVLNRSFEVEESTNETEQVVATEQKVESSESKITTSEVEIKTYEVEIETTGNENKVVVDALPHETPVDMDILSEHDISTTSIDMENKVTIVDEGEKESGEDAASPDSSKTANEEQLKPSDFDNLKSLESSESSSDCIEKCVESDMMVTVDLEGETTSAASHSTETLVERISVEKFNEIESQELNSLVNKIVADVISNAVAVAPNPLMINALGSENEAKVNEINLESELKEAAAETSITEKKEILDVNSLTPVSSSLSLFKKLSPSQAVKAKLNDKKQAVASDVDCFGCNIL